VLIFCRFSLQYKIFLFDRVSFFYQNIYFWSCKLLVLKYLFLVVKIVFNEPWKWDQNPNQPTLGWLGFWFHFQSSLNMESRHCVLWPHILAFMTCIIIVWIKTWFPLYMIIPPFQVEKAWVYISVCGIHSSVLSTFHHPFSICKPPGGWRTDTKCRFFSEAIT
jgi:hypothetical protein